MNLNIVELYTITIPSIKMILILLVLFSILLLCLIIYNYLSNIYIFSG